MPDETGDPLYSLAHLTLINATAPELIYIAARAGYDAVSPRFIQMNVPGEFRESPIDQAMVRPPRRRCNHGAEGSGCRTCPHYRRL